MSECLQTQGQSVLQHGESVKDYLFDLLNHLRHNQPLKHQWILPDWILSNKDFILSQLPDDETLELYTTFHDCGKHFCLMLDENGKRHFPNHAEISYYYFNQVFDNQIAADLIRHDMDIHLLKSKDVDEFCKNPNAITLLITGLAEIHSNAEMFGGISSTSFRIKCKSIIQRGKSIIHILKNKI